VREAGVLTFVHRFSRTVQCEMKVRDEPPGPRKMLSCEHQWTGRPKRKHLPHYRRWALCTTQFLADRWNQRVPYALGTAPNRTELWAFEPGAAPKLLEKINCGIS
jgi:hypothetical protein